MSFASRLDALDERARALVADALVVLYRMPDGTERTGTIDEMEQDGGTFSKVVDGGSLRDLDRILAKMKEEAEKYTD